MKIYDTEAENASIVEEIREMRRQLKRELEKGRQETKSEIQKLEVGITKIEERWLERKRVLKERMERLEGMLGDIEIKRGKKEEKIKERLKRLEIAEGTKRAPSKRQEEEEMKDREARRELREIKRRMEEKEKLERKCNIVVRWLEEKKKNIDETVREFIEKEFGITDGIEKMEVARNKEREVTVVKLKDWKTKMRVMREKGKLGKKKIYIDHNMTKEEREVQRIIRERAIIERKEKGKVKIGYRKLDVEGKRYVWKNEKNKLMEKNF